MNFETLTVQKEGAVLFAEIVAPPMNLLGPTLVRDLVSLIQDAEAVRASKVLVFKSADPDYFISHVDVTRIKEYRDEAAKLIGEASLGLLFRHLSASRLITIAQVEGRARAGGSEFVLACDMSFAARESAIFAQPEAGLGLMSGAGGMQHLTRLMGRGRALEAHSERGRLRCGSGRALWLDQSRAAHQGARRFRQIARASDREVSGGQSPRGQGPGRRHRARAGRGLPPRFQSLRRGREEKRGAGPHPGGDEAWPSDPRGGNGFGQDAG
jgi:enoyl-CoA hydratase/carnithine racemase